MVPRLYTDASIRQTVGIGGIHGSKMVYAYLIDGQKDINRAELAAIYVGLLTAPLSRRIQVLSDSETAINLLNGKKYHKRFSVLVECIRFVARVRFNDSVIFTKIKGHTGIYGNDVAHRLSRIGTQPFYMPDEQKGANLMYVEALVHSNVQKNRLSLSMYKYKCG
jgi:ribonuclease HI